MLVGLFLVELIPPVLTVLLHDHGFGDTVATAEPDTTMSHFIKFDTDAKFACVLVRNRRVPMFSSPEAVKGDRRQRISNLYSFIAAALRSYIQW